MDIEANEADYAFERKITIKELANDLKQKYLPTVDRGSMTVQALKTPITQEMLNTNIDGIVL